MKQVFLESHNIDNLYIGFGQFNLHLIKALAAIEQDEFRFTIHGSDISSLRKEFGRKVDYKRYFAFRRYPEFRIRKKYDIWHALNQNTKIEPYHQQPYLLTVHNTLFLTDPNNEKQVANFNRFQEKLDKCAAIVYISKFAKESVHELYRIPEVPEFIIYNGNTITDITLPADFNLKVPVTRPYLFTIGELASRKNYASLLRMLKHLPQYDLIIAGKHETKEGEKIKALAKELQIEDRLKLVGRVGDFDKQYYYKNCEAFVFPSLREGFGLPVIEAMRFGKPVFLSNLTSLPEVGGDEAYYWEHFDPQYMAQRLLQGLKTHNADNTHAAKLIERSKRFTWEEAARQYIEVYRLIG